MDDHQAVVGQLGRTIRSGVDAVARCHLGLPVVVAVPPLLDDGTPFPTRFWLTCPLARRRVGRLEAAGGIAAAQRRIDADPAYAARYDRAMERYAAARDRLVDPDHRGPVPAGGVGGSGGGVKCLHAHYADHAAGSDNPVGADVAAEVEPFPCAVACVIMIGGLPSRNPDWSAPTR